jgi:hypothetical protein
MRSRPISNSILPSGTNGGILSAMELRCECNFATSGVGISEASFGNLLVDGRTTLFDPCHSKLSVREQPVEHSIGNSLFVKTQWDEEVGTSYEDRMNAKKCFSFSGFLRKLDSN